ncbi:MAG: hypothetical protein Q8R98_03990, partial [Rubrivivax sp.]|nr:hypothetical protein [Rubrivivax sp.]
VTLDALYVEGLVHNTELGGEYYRFDDARLELRGERTGIRYGVGTRVRVQVSRVDLDGRKIDFRMVREGETDKLLAKGGKPERAERSRAPGAAGELSAVQEADRVAKAATRAFKGGGRPAGKTAGKGSGGKAADDASRRSRKPGPQRPTPKPRTRR